MEELLGGLFMVSHMTKYGKVEDADTVVLVTGLLQQFLVRYGYSHTHAPTHTECEGR